MTTQEFKKKIKKKPDFNLYYNYTISTVPIILGFYAFEKTNDIANNFDDLTHKLIYVFPISFIVVGLFCLYLVTIKDNVQSIKSDLPIGDKISIIKDYLTKLNATNIKINRGEISCYYDTFLRSHMELIAYVDSEKIIYKIRLMELGVTELGVTDFGLSYRHSKRFKKYLCHIV
jgi:hypothetical protein